MRAQVLYGIGNLKYVDVEKPAPKSGEALIKVERCGICGSDVPRIYKTGAHNMPLIPGHEMAGIIEDCPDRPDLVGKRTGIFPLIPCKECTQCREGHYEMCEKYDYLGSRSDGGFAEYVVAPIWNLLPVPEEIGPDDAAMLEPMCVAVHALRLVGLLDPEVSNSRVTNKLKSEGNAANGTNDKCIVVCGLGTIGLLTALFLKDAGYNDVIFVGNKDIQKKKLLEMGYAEARFIDVRYCDPVAAIMDRSGGAGADYYLECIGRSESYEQAVKCTGPLGHIMLVGNPASDMELPREVYWKILRNQMTLRGTWNSGFPDDWSYALERLASWTADKSSGATTFLPSNLITHHFTLEDLPKGLDIMHRKSEDYVKVMVEI